MSVSIQLRRGTAAAWVIANPTLAQGEMGYETDTLAYKIGDGATAWNSLGYPQLNGAFIGATFTNYAAGSEPSAPAAGFTILYSTDIAGDSRLKYKHAGSGRASTLQESMYQGGIIAVFPATTTTFTTFGAPAFTAIGTVSTPVIASGSLRASTRRAIVTSAGVTNSASELRHAQTQVWRGDAAGLGGFFSVFTFGGSTAVAGQRYFVGWLGVTTAIATTQDPVALTNCIGVGNAAADANLQVLYNDAAGTCTKINLGASFPVPSSVNNAIYEAVFFAKPNGSTVGYRVTRLDTGAVTSGTLNTDLPASTVFLAPHFYMNNNAVVAAVVLDFYRFYTETDY